MRADDLLGRIRQTITAHRLWSPGARIVVAVSGGLDSVALLHVLITLRADWKLTLHLAHLDHGLRDVSAQDAEFVRGLGVRWRIPTTIERRDVGAICAQEGWSLEDGARRIRYQFLLETAHRQRANRIALGHTADDQAETVLMRLVRGTGLLGLSAMPMTRALDRDVCIVRPLLEVWRRDLAAMVKRERVAYREDATNSDPRFVRNRIRHELLPLLEEHYNPNVKSALTQLAEQSRSDYAYLEQAAGRQWKRMVKVLRSSRPSGAAPHGQAPPPNSLVEGQVVVISLKAFRRQPKALQRQLIRQAIRRVRGDLGRLEFRHWLEVERLVGERPVGTVLDLPGGVQVRRDQDHLICQQTPP